MISNFTVLAIPQYAIFAAVTVIVYGWVEKKRTFGIIGSGILVLLGLFAGYAIFAGLLMPGYMPELSDNLPKEELFTPDELPVEGRFLPFYWVLVINGVIALGALAGEIYHRKFGSILKVIAAIFSILVFFLMMSVIRS